MASWDDFKKFWTSVGKAIGDFFSDQGAGGLFLERVMGLIDTDPEFRMKCQIDVLAHDLFSLCDIANVEIVKQGGKKITKDDCWQQVAKVYRDKGEAFMEMLFLLDNLMWYFEEWEMTAHLIVESETFREKVQEFCGKKNNGNTGIADVTGLRYDGSWIGSPDDPSKRLDLAPYLNQYVPEDYKNGQNPGTSFLIKGDMRHSGWHEVGIISGFGTNGPRYKADAWLSEHGYDPVGPDPAYGQKKTIHIELTSGGKTIPFECQEGQWFNAVGLHL